MKLRKSSKIYKVMVAQREGKVNKIFPLNSSWRLRNLPPNSQFYELFQPMNFNALRGLQRGKRAQCFSLDYLIASPFGRLGSPRILLRCPANVLGDKHLRPSLTAATRSGRLLRHRRRSHRSPYGRSSAVLWILSHRRESIMQ